MGSTAGPQDGSAFNDAILACTHEIINTLSRLQERYGTGAVFAALTDIAGCSRCVTHADGQPTVESLRALHARIEHHRLAQLMS